MGDTAYYAAAFLLRYFYLALALAIAVISVVYSLIIDRRYKKALHMLENGVCGEMPKSVRCIIGFILLEVFTAGLFGLLLFRGEAFDGKALIFGLVVICMHLFAFIALSLLTRKFDYPIMLIVATLLSLGLSIQYRMSPDVAFRQLVFVCIGGIGMFLVLLLFKFPRLMRYTSYLLGLGSIAILVALLFLGKESGGAKNWISIAGILFQPSEFVKVAFVFVLANALTDRTEPKKLFMPIMFTVSIALLLVLQKDLGAAMLILCAALFMYYAASGDLKGTFTGVLLGCAGAIASYFVFDHVKVRVKVWLDPWATYATSGYQIAQGLIAIASGGICGMGFGLGSPKSIPAYHTDYVFAVICEEFGLAFGVIVIALLLLLFLRGIRVALNSEDRFSALVAFGASVMIAFQGFIIIAGVIKLIPLTGITLPFVSCGGSSVIASMLFIGLIEGISANNLRRLEVKKNELKVRIETEELMLNIDELRACMETKAQMLNSIDTEEDT